jgi:putative ABC transport system permease protein
MAMNISRIHEHLWQSWRHLRRRPWASLVVMTTLALVIGANTTIFTLVYGFLLRPFPFDDSDRLVRLLSISAGAGQAGVDVSVPDLEDYRAATGAFVDIGVMAERTLDLVDGGNAQSVDVAVTTPGALNALGVTPMLGRTFLEEEDRPGSDGDKAILSYDLWMGRYGGDRNILGRRLHTPMADYTVVGVMPRGYSYPRRTEMWVPLYGFLKSSNKDWVKLRGSRMYPAIGRLRPGVTLPQAQAELDAISTRLAHDYPITNKEYRLGVQRLRDAETGPIRPYLLLLFIATTLVLVVCAANLANLSLAVAADRARESAVRMALGASRGRLAGLFLTESVLVSLAGGLAGALLARAGVAAIPRLVPTPLPAWVNLEPDLAVLAFTTVISIAMGVGFGLAPALYAARANASAALRQGTRSSTGMGWLRRTLLITEVAFCFTLLIGAGLLVKNFDRLRRIDPGFTSHHLLTFKLAPYRPGKSDEAVRRYADFYDRVISRLEALPGVLAVGASNAFPFEDGTLTRQDAKIGVKGDNEQEQTARGSAVYADVTPRYFEAMGIPLVEGRVFNRTDTHDRQQAVIISERTARLLFPGRPAVGQEIRLVFLDASDPWAVVVGVVGDVSYTATEQATGLELYYPYTQYPVSTSRVAVRFSGDPAGLSQAVGQAMRDVAPDTAVSEMALADQLMLDTLWQQRLWGFLLASFAGLALLLAAVGLYGVIGYLVKQRQFEFGIRIALGASRRRIVADVTGEGLRLVIVGLVVGTVLSVALAGTISALLVAVTAYDPIVFVAVPLLVILVGVLATLVSAYRSMAVEPTEALRAQ